MLNKLIDHIGVEHIDNHTRIAALNAARKQANEACQKWLGEEDISASVRPVLVTVMAGSCQLTEQVHNTDIRNYVHQLEEGPIKGLLESVAVTGLLAGISIGLDLAERLRSMGKMEELLP